MKNAENIYCSNCRVWGDCSCPEPAQSPPGRAADFAAIGASLGVLFGAAKVLASSIRKVLPEKKPSVLPEAPRPRRAAELPRKRCGCGSLAESVWKDADGNAVNLCWSCEQYQEKLNRKKKR